MALRLDMMALATSGSDTEPLSIDASIVAELKAKRRRRFATFQEPALRLAGSAILIFIVVVSNAATGATSWTLVTGLAAVLLLHCAVTWTTLALAPDHALSRLGLVFLTTDPFVWMGAVYVTGGAESWLYFLPLVRVADQINRSRAKVFFFTAVAVAAYATLLAYIAVVDHQPISWPPQVARLMFLAGCGSYLALTAGTAERLRVAVSDAVRTARESIRQLQEQSALLQESQARAHEANVAKGQFIANMSHEFRTPLNAIIGYTELLQDEWAAASAETRGDLERIHSAARHLTSLINDVIDFSRSESGRLTLHVEPFSVESLVSEAAAVVLPQVHAHHNTLAIDGAVAAGTMRADPAKVRQILLNLLGNAAKFTQNGKIVLACEADSSDGPAVVFTVRDTGIGMTPEQLAIIRRFEPFVQAEGSVTRKYGGMGLGLSISHRLCGAMGGTLTIDSQPGQGSTVRVRLPASVDAEGSVAL